MPFEIDFLPVGDGKDSGDAIAMRFTHPTTGRWVHVVIDAGFQDDGEALVDHVLRYYDDDHIDLAILTHPDGDHIGGMGKVLQGLSVDNLLLHKIGERGGAGLPAADAVEDLIERAETEGTSVVEEFAGATAFNGALTILGPDEDYYHRLVTEQQVAAMSQTSASHGSLLTKAMVALSDRIAAMPLPVEIPFDEGEGTSPRNHSSIITLWNFGGHRVLLTGDAGVDSLDRAWEWLENSGLDASPPNMIQLPHHGSRRNASSALLDRILGTGAIGSREALVSVSGGNPKHPSSRIANAYKRRGYPVTQTAGNTVCHNANTMPTRQGWGPAASLPWLDESAEG
jgi:beta-lactamase superfamily II metal-dependent hydrolase